MVNVVEVEQIKQAISDLDQGRFQQFCDVYLHKSGYHEPTATGLSALTARTKTGNPDTYFQAKDGRMVLVMYTTQAQNVEAKVREDVEKCLNITGLPTSEIGEIIFCYSKDSVSASCVSEMQKKCSNHNVVFIIKGVSAIAYDLFNNHYYGIIGRMLGLKLTTNQVFDIDDFVQAYDRTNALSGKLDTHFFAREAEKEALLNAFSRKNPIVLVGAPGTGKTRLALECLRTLAVQGVTILCIKPNNQPLIDDLKLYMDNPGKYIVFIDDANRLGSQLPDVIDFLLTHHQKIEVKILLTVRDYAKQQIADVFLQRRLIEIVQVKPLSDQEIYELVKQNADITRHGILKQINRIANGNPRLAMQAAQLRFDEEGYAHITNASTLYDDLFGQALRDRTIASTSLYLVAATVAFFSIIRMDEYDTYVPFQGEFPLSVQDFNAAIDELDALEFINLSVVSGVRIIKISDQSATAYCLRVAICDQCFISLASLLRLFSASHGAKLVSALNTLIDVFGNEKLFSDLCSAAHEVWNEVVVCANETPWDIIKLLSPLVPDKALLFAQQQIMAIPSESFSIGYSELSKDIRGTSTNDVLDVLCGIKDGEQAKISTSLILEYAQKNKSSLDTVIQYVKEGYSIDDDSHDNNFVRQYDLLNQCLSIIEGNHQSPLIFVLLRMIKDYLLLEYRHDFFQGQVYHMLHFSPGIDGNWPIFRKRCWEILGGCTSAVNDTMPFLHIMYNYASGYGDVEKKEIIAFDLPFIEQLSSTFLEPSHLIHCFTVSHLRHNLDHHKVDMPDSFHSFLANPGEMFISMLSYDHLPWSEDREDEAAIPKAYAAHFSIDQIAWAIDIIATYKNFLDLFALENHSNYHIQEGLCDFIISLPIQCRVMYEFLKVYFKSNTPIRICSDKLFGTLFANYSIEEFHDLITLFDFDYQNEWLFFFFQQMPNEHRKAADVDEIVDVVCAISNRITNYALRDISFVREYRKMDSNAMRKILTALLRTNDHHNFLFGAYSLLLFNEFRNKPDEILTTYAGSEDLIEKLYLEILKSNANLDHTGGYLKALIHHKPDFLYDYVDFIIENDISNHYTLQNLRIVWELSDSDVLMNCLLTCISDMNYLRQDKWIMALLTPEEGNAPTQIDEWLSNYISNNAGNQQTMGMLFDVICKFSVERKLPLYQCFLQVNSSPDDLRRLPFEPSSFSWSGSALPIYQKRIQFIEMLLSMLTTPAQLQQRTILSDKIRVINTQIQHETIREVMRE